MGPEVSRYRTKNRRSISLIRRGTRVFRKGRVNGGGEARDAEPRHASREPDVGPDRILHGRMMRQPKEVMYNFGQDSIE